MIILKIRQKGLFLNIPGLLPTRTPAEIDITRCDLAVISTYLRKEGVVDYEIIARAPKKENIPIESAPNIPDAMIDQKIINQRFHRLENLMEQLLRKEVDKKEIKSEQITNRLQKIESIAEEILKSRPLTETELKQKLKREPKIEELDDKFIPSIDVSGLKMRSSSTTSIKQKKSDIDDSADLLSRLVGFDD